MKRLVSILWGISVLLVALLCTAQLCFDNFWPFAVAFLLFALIWRC